MAQRVTIFGCGVQKGGTTTLHAYFAEHPQLSAPLRKETHFFDDETQDWSWPDYRVHDAFYKSDDGAKRRFDITPIYGYWPPTLERIAAYNGQAKLITLWRDPFKRAWSHWKMQRARRVEKLGFSEALAAEAERLRAAGETGEGRRLYSYVDRGRYATQLRRAEALFPRAQILNLRSEDLFGAPGPTLARIAAFLEIDPFPEMAPKHEMKRERREAPPTRADFDHVAAALEGELAEFAALSGLDISGWMKPPSDAPAPAPKKGLLARLTGR